MESAGDDAQPGAPTQLPAASAGPPRRPVPSFPGLVLAESLLSQRSQRPWGSSAISAASQSGNRLGLTQLPNVRGQSSRLAAAPASPGSTFIGNLCYELSTARTALPGCVTKSRLNHGNNVGKHEKNVKTPRSPPLLLR